MKYTHVFIDTASTTERVALSVLMAQSERNHKDVCVSMCMCETKRDKSSLWIVSVLCLGDQNYNNNTYILELLFIKQRKHHGVRKK